MVQEFSEKCSNEWEGTIKRDPEWWTAKTQLEVYQFLKVGRGHALRTDKFVVGKFSTHINPKDGHAIADCEDFRERRVLQFVVPILYLEKPTQIIVTLANTIFDALLGARPVSWGIITQDLVGKLVSGLEKGKPSSISPYLFHFYNRFECFREGEMTMLEVAQYMLQFDIAPEAQAKLDPKGEDSERELLSSVEIQRLKTLSPGAKKKSTYRAVNGKTPVQMLDYKAIAMTSFDFEKNLFQRIWDEMDQLQGQYSKLEYVAKGACKLFGNCRLANIYKERPYSLN